MKYFFRNLYQLLWVRDPNWLKLFWEKYDELRRMHEYQPLDQDDIEIDDSEVDSIC